MGLEVIHAPMGQVAGGLVQVADRIAAAADRSGRDRADVTLIAVSKGFAASRISEAIVAGQMEFGENRVHELVDKVGAVPGDVHWHFVGRLQTNKVRQLLPWDPTIHSVDRIGLARQISRRAERPVRVLVEVNVAGDPKKAGVSPSEAPDLVGQVLELPNLDLIGLMTMAPRSDDPETARPVFRRLAQLREEVVTAFSWPRIRHLSMGMSQDYEVAVEEGATMVRVGEAIFGRRDPIRPDGESQAAAQTKSRER